MITFFMSEEFVYLPKAWCVAIEETLGEISAAIGLVLEMLTEEGETEEDGFTSDAPPSDSLEESEKSLEWN